MKLEMKLGNLDDIVISELEGRLEDLDHSLKENKKWKKA